MHIKVNGLEFSSENTNMILFDNGSGPKELPQFKLDGQDLLYKSEMKFLEVYLTTTLDWKMHLETLLSKARKGSNFLKIIINIPWG